MNVFKKRTVWLLKTEEANRLPGKEKAGSTGNRMQPQIAEKPGFCRPSKEMWCLFKMHQACEKAAAWHLQIPLVNSKEYGILKHKVNFRAAPHNSGRKAQGVYGTKISMAVFQNARQSSKGWLHF